jgi:uncharacterized membrane protein
MRSTRLAACLCLMFVGFYTGFPNTTFAEDVEEIETVEEATVAEANTQEAPTSPSVIAGRMHPIFVHMPIAWMMLLLMSEGLSLLLRKPSWSSLGLPLTALTCLSFIPAIASGLLRMNELPQTPENLEPALLHRNAMFACATVCAIAATLRYSLRSRWHGLLPWVYLGILAVGCGLLGYGSHLGGELVYGEEFLPF